MRPLFTVHAGEFLVGQHIEGFKGKNVWVPTKDTGVDLLVTNSANTKTVTLQVKFSRDLLPVMKYDPSILKNFRSCTWFSLDRNKLARSIANFLVFVLPGFDKHTCDYVIIKPSELKKRLDTLHSNSMRYHTYVWLTKHSSRAWLTRDTSKQDRQKIAEDTFENRTRDLTRYLNDWSFVRNL